MQAKSGNRERKLWEYPDRGDKVDWWGQYRGAQTTADHQTHHRPEVPNSLQEKPVSMPAQKKDPPRGKKMYCPMLSVAVQLDLDFEVSNDDSRKVRCTVCLASNRNEQWISRNSATTHTRSERHNRSAAAMRQRADDAARADVRWANVVSEIGRPFGDGFVPADALPSIRVTKNKLKPMSSQLQAEEEEEMMRRVLGHLSAPHRNGSSGGHSFHNQETADQSLEAEAARTVARSRALPAPDPNTEDEVLAQMMKIASTWVVMPQSQRLSDPILSRSTDVCWRS